MTQGDLNTVLAVLALMASLGLSGPLLVVIAFALGFAVAGPSDRGRD